MGPASRQDGGEHSSPHTEAIDNANILMGFLLISLSDMALNSRNPLRLWPGKLL